MDHPTLRVLYIDDDRINTLLFVETCRPDRSLQVSTAASGEEALEVARHAQPELLVVDLHLPDTDGLALLKALRELPGQRTTPAFLCTAEQIEEVAQPALQAGFDGVWIKPVQLDAMLRDLQRVQAFAVPAPAAAAPAVAPSAAQGTPQHAA